MTLCRLLSFSIVECSCCTKTWVSDEPYCAYAFESYGTVWPTVSYCTVWPTESYCILWPAESCYTVCWVSIVQCFRFVVEVTDISLPPKCPHELWTDSSTFSMTIEGCFPRGRETWCMVTLISVQCLHESAELYLHSSMRPHGTCGIFCISSRSYAGGSEWQQWFCAAGWLSGAVDSLCLSNWCRRCVLLLYITLWQVLWLLLPQPFAFCYSRLN